MLEDSFSIGFLQDEINYTYDYKQSYSFYNKDWFSKNTYEVMVRLGKTTEDESIFIIYIFFEAHRPYGRKGTYNKCKVYGVYKDRIYREHSGEIKKIPKEVRWAIKEYNEIIKNG